MKSIWLLVLLFAFGACAPTVNYTMMSGALKEQHKLTEKDLKQYQYYLSERVVLYHDESIAKRKLNDSDLIVDKIDLKDKVIIPSGTAGVFHAYVDNNTIAIKFEDCEGCVLLFGNDKRGNYTLKAQDWDKNGFGHLMYGGKNYVVYPQNADAGIYLKAIIQSKVQSQERTVSGVKLEQ